MKHRTWFENRTIISALLMAALNGGCSGADESPPAEGESVSSSEQEIRFGTRVPSNAHLGVVQVLTSRGNCSGTVIAADTILTSAHCFCGEDVIGSNKCSKTAEITYRPDPAGGTPRKLSGVARIHPSYNPSWIEAQYEHDVATVTVDGVSPAHVPPVSINGSYLSEGTSVNLVGFGRTGSDCSGAFGTLNQVSARIHSYEDGKDIMAFSGAPWCKGDSGGAVFDAQGRQRAIISMHAVTLQKAVTTNSEYDWIKAGMCRSSRYNRCDGDGVTCDCTARKDLLLQNSNGALAIWALNGGTLESQEFPGTVYSDWQIQGSGDFDADGQADILWRHDTGQVAVWFMKDGARVGEGYPGGADPSQAWKIQGTGDFDADGRSDILWRHTGGALAIWFQGDATKDAYPGYSTPGQPVGNEWSVKGTGDFDGDGRSDILWQNNLGQTAIWLMNGATRSGDVYPGTLPTTTQFVSVGDFDGNLKSDSLWRNSDGSLTVWFGLSGGSDKIQNRNTPGPNNSEWSVAGVGDFDHDGRDDLLWRHTTGQFAIWLVQGARFNGDLYPPHLDSSWKVKALMQQSGM